MVMFSMMKLSSALNLHYPIHQFNAQLGQSKTLIYPCVESAAHFVRCALMLLNAHSVFQTTILLMANAIKAEFVQLVLGLMTS